MGTGPAPTFVHRQALLELRGAHDRRWWRPQNSRSGAIRVVDSPKACVPGRSDATAWRSGLRSCGEQHAVAVVGRESVLQLVERLEIDRPGDAYRRLAAVAIAPGDVVFVARASPRAVVAVDPGPRPPVGTFEAHILLGDVPVRRPSTEKPAIQPHADVGVVAARNTPA